MKGWCYTTCMDTNSLQALRLDGMSYQEIAAVAGVSRQAVFQRLRPPARARVALLARDGDRCADCGIGLRRHGEVHRAGSIGADEYADLSALVLLCLSCHRRAHRGPASSLAVAG